MAGVYPDDISMQKNDSNSKGLFRGSFDSVIYELRHDGLYFDKPVCKSTESAIRERIQMIFSDSLHKEHKNFDIGLSYVQLYEILNK